MMKECPHCHKEIPIDSMFCYHCGKAVEELPETNEESKKPKLKKNPRVNSWSKLGMMLFLIGLIGFDFIIGTVVSAFEGNVKIPYIISALIYIIAIVCGVLSLYTDRQDLKKGYEPNGNKNYAYVSIVLGIFIILVNLSQIILK